MADASDIPRLVTAAQEAAEECARVRTQYRWHVKKDDPTRKADLQAALDTLARAMAPIRSEIGKILWHPTSASDERALRAVSARCGYERKQLKKML